MYEPYNSNSDVLPTRVVYASTLSTYAPRPPLVARASLPPTPAALVISEYRARHPLSPSHSSPSLSELSIATADTSASATPIPTPRPQPPGTGHPKGHHHPSSVRSLASDVSSSEIPMFAHAGGSQDSNTSLESMQDDLAKAPPAFESCTAEMTKVLYWFRTDLRLHDSPALKVALDLKPTEFYPTWCWDPKYVFETRVGANRWRFLLDSMADVSQSLTALNSQSKLLVVRAPPATILPALWKQWGITDVVWEKDDDEYTKVRDATIEALAKAAGVKVHVVLGHTLYDSDKIIAKGKGCPRTYAGFLKLIGSMPAPALPIPAPASIPSPGALDLHFERENHSVDKWMKGDLNHESRAAGTSLDLSYASFAGPLGDFAVPTMAELGMVATGTIRGGEKEGLQVFESFMEDKTRVAMFKKPQTSPAAFEPASTTVLSPHMKFGTLSARLFYHRVLEINKKHKGHSEPPESLVGQVLWREFFHANQADTPHFGEVRGNSTSRYISERGAEVFEQYLVDHDPALNNGNWMWLSASAFFAMYFRVYSPVTYGQKSDKSGALVRRFVPELSKLSDKYVYEPWKASIAEQTKAGCLLYPKRMVDEKEARELSMLGMKAAYSAKMQGNDKRVLNGTADAVIAALQSNAAAPAGGDDSEDEKPKKTVAKRKAPSDARSSKQPKLSFGAK
ncbi:hypothetical protein RQP46_008402 [Phenoliferia psychrophenolica]